MNELVILGAGKIGRMVCHFMSNCGSYKVRIGDASQAAIDHIKQEFDGVDGQVVDFADGGSVDAILKGAWAVISCAPFHCNPLIAARAKAHGVHYFDLTEDVEVTAQVKQLAEGSATLFAPQCGLAPGFITVTANHLMQSMTEVTDLRLRVGALPRFPSNRLKYNLTWSTAGLINEYCNPCESVENGELTSVPPMEQLEHITIDGVEYEAFNTSGGLGSLAETLDGKVRNLRYLTARYPGHRDIMRMLLTDLGLRDRRDLMRDVMETAVAATRQDTVLIFITASGTRGDTREEMSSIFKVAAQEVDGETWSAIQLTTSSGICAALDLVRNGRLPRSGFLRQETIPLDAMLENRFGKVYAQGRVAALPSRTRP